VGHSQGTTQAFASFIIHPEIAAKINVFVALAPVTNATFVTNPFMRLLADLQIDTILDFFGEKQFLPTPGVLEKYFEAFCRLDPIICDDIVELIVGKHKGSFNESRMQVMASHEPGGTSVHNMAHWGQSIRKGSYSMFDYGAQENKKRYNSTTPPAYDIKKLPRNLPIGIFYGEADELASAKGVKQLIASLPTPPVLVKDVPQYAHLDFCWCTQAYKDIYESVVSLLQQYKPKNDLFANGYRSKPSSEFYLGQHIQVKIMKSNPKHRKMLCSMNINSSTEMTDANTASLLWCRVVDIRVDCFIVKVLQKNKNKTGDAPEKKRRATTTRERTR